MLFWTRAIVSVAFLVVVPLGDNAIAYTEKTLYTFCSASKCADGAYPYGGLVMDAAGNLYGTTQGGANNYARRTNGGAGVVFEFQPATNQYTVLYKFCSQYACADGENPFLGSLVIDETGNLYGTAYLGGLPYPNDLGVVFELVKRQSGWKEKILYTFGTRRHDGANPWYGLTYAGAAAGQPYDGTSPLYGATYNGGANYGGVVFSLSPKQGTKKWVETVLYSFCAQANCADGEYPATPLLVDTGDNIYGTTQLGGQCDDVACGTVFELSPSGTSYAETVLHTFCVQANCADGREPQAGVVMDGTGNLFGTATYTGSTPMIGEGLVFELSPNGGQWQFGILHTFDGKDGRNPTAPLIIDGNGNVFGTTYRGGAPKMKGTVFEFNGSVQSLYDFCGQTGCADGKNPAAGLIEDQAGDFFGTTTAGGGHDAGVLYELSP